MSNTVLAAFSACKAHIYIYIMTVFDVRFVRIEVKETCLCGKLNKNNLLIQDACVAISFKIKLKGVIFINLLFTLTCKLFFPA